ncbi:MAG: hypothetical protein SPF89_07595 [Sphaerochaetaceae bacterium]|nr:hypothetical protein [Spirochaetales bacterium]MDY5499950.1 hypothetical protein [Sphaerochaetaceae bacterium]
MTNLTNILSRKSLRDYYRDAERAVASFGFAPEAVRAILAEAGRKGVSAEAVVIYHINSLYNKEAR